MQGSLGTEAGLLCLCRHEQGHTAPTQALLYLSMSVKKQPSPIPCCCCIFWGAQGRLLGGVHVLVPPCDQFDFCPSCFSPRREASSRYGFVFITVRWQKGAARCRRDYEAWKRRRYLQEQFTMMLYPWFVNATQIITLIVPETNYGLYCQSSFCARDKTKWNHTVKRGKREWSSMRSWDKNALS